MAENRLPGKVKPNCNKGRIFGDFERLPAAGWRGFAPNGWRKTVQRYVVSGGITFVTCGEITVQPASFRIGTVIFRNRRMRSSHGLLLAK
jgi:hypothetical protein